MKKLFKWVFGVVVSVIFLLALALFVLPLVFDPNDHKLQIQQVVTEKLGREIELDGPIQWSVFPWVAINLNHVSIKNESGFKGEALAKIERVAVRVKLLPLLKKQIQVGQIELQKPQILLQVAKSGANNWQSIVDHLDSADDRTEADKPGTNLEVRGLLITDGALTYKDASSDIEFLLNILVFESDVIKAGQATPMGLEADVNVPTQDISGTFNAAWQASGIAEGSGIKMEFSEMSFTGSQAAVPLRLDTATAVIDFHQDTLSTDELSLSYGSMNLTTDVQGTQLSNRMSMKGNLIVAEFSLKNLLSEIGSSLDNHAENQLSGKTQWSLTGDRLNLNDLLFKLDESNIKGDLSFSQLSQMQGEFNFAVDQINLDDYLPADSTKNGSGDADVAINFGYLKGQIKIQSLAAAGVDLADITLQLKTQGADLFVEPLQAGFYQGRIKTELRLGAEKSAEMLQVTHSMQDFQAGGLLSDLIGTAYLTGLGQLSADISVDQPFSEKPLKTANGTVSYKLSDGDIVGVDVYQIMQQSLSLLNKSDVVQNNTDLKTAFGIMEVNANIRNGVLKTNTLRLNSPYFDLNGEVEIDLDAQTIKGTIKPMLTNIPEGVLDENFKRLINLRIPVTLKGNLLAPDVSIDVAKLLLATQQEKIDKKKEELKADLFNKLLGNDKEDQKTNETPDGQQPELTEKQKQRAEKEQLKRDLLNNLLGGGKNPAQTDKKDEEEADPDGEN